MNTMLLKMYLKFQELTSREEGQDMVEYALVLGLICFGAASASKFLSAALAQTFDNISSNVGSYVS
jgi:Flp pilus assembly pilin Flp